MPARRVSSSHCFLLRNGDLTLEVRGQVESLSPCINPTPCPRSRFPRWSASTRHSTARTPMSRSDSPCRQSSTMPAFGATASTGCPTSTLSPCWRGSTPRGGRGQDDRAASGQRLEHVRARRRPEPGEHDGFHDCRRARHGHALRSPGSRRDPVSPERARDECPSRRAAHLPRVRTAGRLRRLERRISAADSRVAAWVIPTNEELMIARHTRRVLDSE
jgi:hypothetical protein